MVRGDLLCYRNYPRDKYTHFQKVPQLSWSAFTFSPLTHSPQEPFRLEKKDFLYQPELQHMFVNHIPCRTLWNMAGDILSVEPGGSH